MQYLTKQKFNISDLAPVVKHAPRVLLVVSEDYLREIYLRHLLRSNFEVNAAAFGDFLSIAKHLERADSLVMELKNSQAEDRVEFLKLLALRFPSMPVVTVGLGLNEHVLKTIMALGVASHLDRQFSRPGDLVQVLKTVFNLELLTE